MGRPDLLADARAASPAAARAGRRALARLRATDVHRVGERVRRDALRRLVAARTAVLDPLHGLDDRLEAALALDRVDGSSNVPARRTGRTIELPSAGSVAPRRAPLARDGGTTPMGARRPIATTNTNRPQLADEGAEDATSGLRAALQVATPAAHPDGRATHALPAALVAARCRPVGTPDPDVTARLATRMPVPTGAATGRSGSSTGPSTHAASTTTPHRRPVLRGSAGAGVVENGHADPDQAAGSTSRIGRRPIDDGGGTAASPVGGPVQAPATGTRVVGLAGLAGHFEQQRATAATPTDADPTIGPTATGSTLGSTTTGPTAVLPGIDVPRWSGDGRSVHDGPMFDDRRGLVAEDLLAARRLADIIGEVVSADARRHGIDLDGIHRP